MNIGFITMEKHENREENSVGSSRIRARWLQKYWQESEEYQIGKKYDFLIFQKAYWKSMLEEYTGYKIFDICDPDWLEHKPVFEAMSLCHAVVCSTDAITDYVKRLVTDKPVITIPDRIDFSEVKHVKTTHTGKARSVFWYGYAHNLKYVERAFPILQSRGLELVYVTNESYHVPHELQARFIKYRYEKVNEEAVKCDFAIMPDASPDTVDLDGRLKYKSNNKKTQCWSWGLPVAMNPADIDRFLDPAERQKESALRLKEVRKDYNVELSVKQYKDLIATLIKA